MNCLRCGVQVEAPNVFCPSCQAEMAKHPVPRDAAVILPTHEPRAPRRVYTPVDPQVQMNQMIKKLRRQRRAIWIVSFLCALLLALLVFAGDTLWKKYPVFFFNDKATTEIYTPKGGSAPTR